MSRLVSGNVWAVELLNVGKLSPLTVSSQPTKDSAAVTRLFFL